MPDYILALNCGSSSIKSKLYRLPLAATREPEASLSISNIGAEDANVQVKLLWNGHRIPTDVELKGDAADYSDMVSMLVEKYTSTGKVTAGQLKYVVHRIVHGGQHTEPITVTRNHTEGLKEMDKLSEFAPLHNHHAVLAVQACLTALPDHTSLLVFDTLFHQTIPDETSAYALPPSQQDLPMPLRKYGFHGLSYASIVRSMAQQLGKEESQINLVVAHLGSGASACCIKSGKSIDTSMGLTPLEGLIGGTRCGTIDPTAMFHHTPDAGEDAGLSGMKVTKAELLLNKQSGLKALAGTTNFATITDGMDQDDKLRRAYAIYLDRLMGYVSQYLFKLLATLPKSEIDGIVFSGGIGEKSATLQRDVLDKLAWLGFKAGSRIEPSGTVSRITNDDSAIAGWVVETDEEGWSVELAHRTLGLE